MAITNTQMLGQQMRAERAALGLTQDDIAERTGYSRARISALENGSNVSTRMLLSYLLALGKGLRIVSHEPGLESLADVLEREDED